MTVKEFVKANKNARYDITVFGKKQPKEPCYIANYRVIYFNGKTKTECTGFANTIEKDTFINDREVKKFGLEKHYGTIYMTLYL